MPEFLMASALAWIEVMRLDQVAEIFLAALLGAAVGLERTAQGKSAGLRTHMLIALGAALFTKLSLAFGGSSEIADPSRVAAQIVSGVGFLGGGVILHAKGEVRGLTTAAGIWVAAAIGMACGAAYYVEAVGTTVMAVLILGVLGRASYPIEKRAQERRKQRGDDDSEMAG